VLNSLVRSKLSSLIGSTALFLLAVAVVGPAPTRGDQRVLEAWCTPDKKQGKCNSPGECGTYTTYCEEVAAYAVCVGGEPLHDCYAWSNYDCGKKYVCATGKEVSPPDNCRLPYNCQSLNPGDPNP